MQLRPVLRRCAASAFAAAMLSVYPLLTSGASVSTSAPSPEQNLLAAMRLWGDIKFFDPAVGGGDAWDTAFLDAEPAIAAATGKAQYAAAITTMLAPLDDPATSVESDASSPGTRIGETALPGATLITVPHGVTDDQTAIASDASKAAQMAAEPAIVAIDLRGVTESSKGDADALNYLFSEESPLLSLVNGSLSLPRERTRAYLGYPTQRQGGYAGYFAQDSISDPETLTGTSKVKHRFVFLVDARTSLPAMAFALAAAGQGAIYSTGGRCAILAASAEEMDLPFGIRATFRTGDAPSLTQLPEFAHAPDLAQAVKEFSSAAPAAPTYATVEEGRTRRVKDDPYADASFPDPPKRMLAVARIYNVIRYFSPYTALMHDDWDAAAARAISDEANATDARSYLLDLMRFYAHLHDSHGYIGGALVGSEFGGGVPFEVRYLRGEAVVTNVRSGIPAVGNLRIGDIIDSINGVAVRSAMREAERLISASTPQAAHAAALSSSSRYSVFTGRTGTSLTIAFHRPASGRASSRETLTVTRDYGTFPARVGTKYFILPGNVGYVDFDRLDPSETDAMFEALKGTRAIVFDNRGYPEGAAWSVAPRLTTANAVRAALFDTPSVIQPLDTTSDDLLRLPSFVHFYQLVPKSSEWKYLKPTVMLIDERAISQSEHSALFFRQAGGTRFVGTPTDGADGDVTSMVAPGAVYLNFTGEGVRWPNGDQLQRVGIRPDVRAEPSAADVAAGNDVVLQKGLEEALRMAGAAPAERAAALKREVAREHSALNAKSSVQLFDVKGSNAQALALSWSVKGDGYRGWADPATGYRNSAELSLESVAGAAGGTASFGSYADALDISQYRGKTIRIRGYLGTERVSGGAGFWLRIDGPSRQFDNMQDRWLVGTSAWQPFAIVLRVPLSATRAFTGLLLVGTGTAHASGLTIDVVPDATPTTGS